MDVRYSSIMANRLLGFFHLPASSARRVMRCLPAAVVVLLCCVGCNNKSMMPGDLTQVQIYSDQPHAGNVYLLRGFIGIWSYGIDGLGRKINESGVRATVYRNEQWHELTDAILAKYKDQKEFEPLVIVGHSWGADNALNLAERLQAANIPVDLIVTLDPVTPPRVPGNVKWCYNIYQPHGVWDTIPFFRGVPLEKAEGSTGTLQNINIRGDRTDLLEPDTDHYNIEKNEKIHKEVIEQILKVCPPRQEWVTSHPSFKAPNAEPMSPDQAARPGPAAKTANDKQVF
jgi:hypothetical protein